MIDSNLEKILKEIFGAETGWLDGEISKLQMCPGFNDIVEIAGMLKEDTSEEKLQIFFRNHPEFIFGLFGSGDEGDLAFLTKPAIGGKYNADFAVLNYSQAGCSINLIEIERASFKLFNKNNTYSSDLQKAIVQIHSWSEWIDKNRNTFVKDTIEYVKKLPQYPEKHQNGSFKLEAPKKIERAWNNFGGYELFTVKYGIVIGRWSKLTDEHRQKLIHTNTKDNALKQIYTYEQLIRTANSRPQRFG